jgi:rubrerythrin
LTEIKDEERFRTIDDILAFAIKKEEEAAAAYGTMIATARTPGLKKLLGELMDEEENHKKLLLELAEGPTVDQEPAKVADLRISDYLIAEPPHPDMGFQNLLIFAARKEHKAAQLYSALALRSTKDGQRKLFEFLAGQEKTHKLRLESEYERHVLGED